jgi:hypothetical protein
MFTSQAVQILHPDNDAILVAQDTQGQSSMIKMSYPIALHQKDPAAFNPSAKARKANPVGHRRWERGTEAVLYKRLLLPPAQDEIDVTAIGRVRPEDDEKIVRTAGLTHEDVMQALIDAIATHDPELASFAMRTLATALETSDEGVNLPLNSPLMTKDLLTRKFDLALDTEGMPADLPGARLALQLRSNGDQGILQSATRVSLTIAVAGLKGGGLIVTIYYLQEGLSLFGVDAVTVRLDVDLVANPSGRQTPAPLLFDELRQLMYIDYLARPTTDRIAGDDFTYVTNDWR